MPVLNSGYEGVKFATKAHAQHLWINGKRCVDYSLCGGTHIFGHSPKFILDAIGKQAKNGLSYAMPHRIGIAYLDEFQKHTSYGSMVFCNSGSEAVMRAFRIARAYTNKNKIVVFNGCWHGSYDGTVWIDHPKGIQHEDVIPLPYDVESIKILEGISDVAMVFIEPFQGSNPQSRFELIKQIRSYCKRSGALLGFDEIISGFRYPGAYHYGVTPDISTYGKIAGGGLPIGIVAGQDEVMSCVKDVFMGGTFSGNPMSLAAGLSVMKRLNSRVRNNLNENADYIKKAINGECSKLSIMGVGSFLRLMFMPFMPISRAERDICEYSEGTKKYVYARLLARGIYIGSNGLIFLSTKHTKHDINNFIKEVILADSSIG